MPTDSGRTFVQPGSTDFHRPQSSDILFEGQVNGCSNPGASPPHAGGTACTRGIPPRACPMACFPRLACQCNMAALLSPAKLAMHAQRQALLRPGRWVAWCSVVLLVLWATFSRHQQQRLGQAIQVAASKDARCSPSSALDSSSGTNVKVALTTVPQRFVITALHFPTGRLPWLSGLM